MWRIVRVSGVGGQQRWSQAERCLARGRYTLPHNILNPFRPAEGPSEGKARTWRVSKGQWRQWTVQVVPGRALPRPRPGRLVVCAKEQSGPRRQGGAGETLQEQRDRRRSYL